MKWSLPIRRSRPAVGGRGPLRRGARALAVGCALALAVGALAQGRADSKRVSPEVQQRVAQAKERLRLTPQQETQLRTLMHEQTQRLRAIQAKYGSDESLNARGAKAREARAVQDDFHNRLAGVLSPAQMAEWDQMASEWRAQARERRQQQQR
ncbi:MAG TPA: hypothetical protein VFU71_13275 [Burkholderiaceae bacterium]|nr:hypothetical protein [Burkholderiaceae bacterium]